MPYCAKCGTFLTDDDLFCPSCGTPVLKKVTTEAGRPSVGSTLPESGLRTLVESPQAQSYWIRRLVALVIDYVILSIIIAVIALIVYVPAIIVSGLSIPNMSWTNFGVFPTIIGLISILYFPASEASRSTTIGKSIMGLKVTTSNGSRTTWGQAFIRNISKIYWILLLLDVVLGLAIQTDYRQKFSDKYAGTVVVQG
ncbi:RDD family protein [Candidatus Bathyarchaeota archaeon]|nr:RDD family protein [Candidatus Bathyarchaeota archaeon]